MMIVGSGLIVERCVAVGVGAWVGPKVTVGVGATVTVGSTVGVGVAVSVGVGVTVSVGVAVSVGVGVGVTVGSGVAVRSGVRVGVGEAVTDGSGEGSWNVGKIGNVGCGGTYVRGGNGARVGCGSGLIVGCGAGVLVGWGVAFGAWSPAPTLICGSTRLGTSSSGRTTGGGVLGLTSTPGTGLFVPPACACSACAWSSRPGMTATTFAILGAAEAPIEALWRMMLRLLSMSASVDGFALSTVSRTRFTLLASSWA